MIQADPTAGGQAQRFYRLEAAALRWLPPEL